MSQCARALFKKAGGVAATLAGGLLWGDRSRERLESSVWMGGQRRLGIDGIGSAFLVVGL